MQEKLQAIVSETESALALVKDKPNLEQLKASVLGGNGSLTTLMKGIGSLPQEDRPAFGQIVNQTKTRLEDLFKEAVAALDAAADAQALGETVDVTLPPPRELFRRVASTHLSETRSRFYFSLDRLYRGGSLGGGKRMVLFRCIEHP